MSQLSKQHPLTCFKPPSHVRQQFTHPARYPRTRTRHRQSHCTVPPANEVRQSICHTLTASHTHIATSRLTQHQAQGWAISNTRFRPH